MSYTYTREWCDISEAALKFELTLDPIEREIIDESDTEALGDGFLDDLHTALTPIEQIANGDYFVN